MQFRTYIHPSDEPIRSVSHVLRRDFSVSAEMCRKLKSQKDALLLNGREARLDSVLYPGDRLTVDLSDREPAVPVEPSDIPAEVIYRDDWLVFANKPAGLITHATTFHPDEDNMEKRIAKALGSATVFHAVNRLDRYTSGLMCVALCGYMHNLLKLQLHTPEYLRYYLCICVGAPAQDEGTISLPIEREPGSVIKRRVSTDGAPAVTRYRVLAKGKHYCLVLCLPLTGRTHQIRLHMMSIGCPLLGDFLYGEEIPGVRCMLHSYRVCLKHPVTGELLRFCGKVPPDFAGVLSGDNIKFHITEDISL